MNHETWVKKWSGNFKDRQKKKRKEEFTGILAFLTAFRSFISERQIYFQFLDSQENTQQEKQKESKMKKNVVKAWMVTGVLLTLSTVGGVMAYFTDKDEAVNQFVVGKVDIKLEEPEWNKKPDLNKNGVPDEVEKIVPRQKIDKDPFVKNTGKNDCYIFMTVEMPSKNIVTVDSKGMKKPAAMTELYTYEKGQKWNYMGSTPIKDGKGQQTGVKRLYAYADAQGKCVRVKPDGVTEPLFRQVEFVNALEGQGLEEGTFEIKIDSFGIQADNIAEGSTDMNKIWNIITNQNDVKERFAQ